MTAVPLQSDDCKGQASLGCNPLWGRSVQHPRLINPRLQAGQLKPNTFIEIRMEGHDTGKLEGYTTTTIPDRLYFLSGTEWSKKRRRSASNAAHSVFVGRTAKRCRKLDVTDAVQSGRCIPKICTAQCPHQASLLQSHQRSMCLSHLEMPDRTTVFECMCRNTSDSLRGRKIDR